MWFRDSDFNSTLQLFYLGQVKDTYSKECFFFKEENKNSLYGQRDSPSTANYKYLSDLKYIVQSRIRGLIGYADILHYFKTPWSKVDRE